jgi:hypothetical protein
MAGSYNNLATAYAVYKTQQFFTEEEQRDANSKPATRFRDAVREYDDMSIEAQLA